MSARRKAKTPAAPVYTVADVTAAAQRAHVAAINALRAVQFIDAADALVTAGLDPEANDRVSSPAARLLWALEREFDRVHYMDYHDDWLARRRAAEARDLTPTEWVRDDLLEELREEQSASVTRLRSVTGPLDNAARAVNEARKALGAAYATGDAEDVQRRYVEGLIAAREAVQASARALAPWVVLRRATRAESDATPGCVLRGDRRICDWCVERQGDVETFESREDATARFEALAGERLHREWLREKLPLIAPEVRP